MARYTEVRSPGNFMKQSINVFWFRRDLRIHDNAGLYRALKDKNPVLPIFIFDRNILDKLEPTDNRVEFIHHTIKGIGEELAKYHSAVEVFYDYPDKVFSGLLKKYNIEKVYTNHDYEPYAIDRDEQIKNILNNAGVSFHTYKDQVIFEKNEIVKDDESPYVVFTPYSKKWRAGLNKFYLKSYPTEKYLKNLYETKLNQVPSLKSMGFKKGDQEIPSEKFPVSVIKHYQDQRDYPGIDGTSRMSIHLRFGTVSIRDLAREAKKLSDVYLNELIWRDFYHMILWHFPRVGKGKTFRKEYELIKWRNNEKEFKAWCEGKTGYPIVDAGMRQLNKTGFMHNRVRMITASFLAKHLLIDWRWGEAYFAEKLLDYDLAANNGGWQWAAGSGCDAAPYFRVFNPTLQTKKFDKDLIYIKKWVPELETLDYPPPIVEHEFARKRCLEAYAAALKRKE